MKLGILSDTHNQSERAARAVERLVDAGAEYLIHCGDFTSPDIVHICGVLPFACVLGNNDFNEVGIRAAVSAIEGTFLGFGGELVFGDRRIAVTHGDNPAVFRRLVATQPDFILFGHTHCAFDSGDRWARQINPGALHRAAQYTVAAIDTTTDCVEFFSIR